MRTYSKQCGCCRRYDGVTWSGVAWDRGVWFIGVVSYGGCASGGSATKLKVKHGQAAAGDGASDGALESAL